MIDSFHMHYISSVKYSSNWYQFSKPPNLLAPWNGTGPTLVCQNFWSRTEMIADMKTTKEWWKAFREVDSKQVEFFYDVWEPRLCCSLCIANPFMIQGRHKAQLKQMQLLHLDKGLQQSVEPQHNHGNWCQMCLCQHTEGFCPPPVQSSSKRKARWNSFTAWWSRVRYTMITDVTE